MIPHEYQHVCIRFLHDRLSRTSSGAGLFLEPGLGKTGTTLTWFEQARLLGYASRALIIAPLRVVYSVWRQEVKKWGYDLKVKIIHGTPQERLEALHTPADIHVVNRESVPWLVDTIGKNAQWDTLVVDESSSFKTWGSKRTKALRKFAPRFRNRIILTGSPCANSIMDLFAQIYLCDLGESLGTAITHFRERYFYQGGFKGYQWKPHEHAHDTIQAKIAHLCLRMEAVDHLDMPDMLVHDVWVDLPDKARKQYKDMEDKLFLELEGVTDGAIVPLSAGARYNACRQIANGGIYETTEESKISHHLHDAKIDAVEEIVDELQGKPVLISYQYKHDLERLQKRFGAKLPVISGGISAKAADKLVDQWNEGKLDKLAVQPQSLSHGVNMQYGPGRDIVTVGIPDSLEIYEQFIQRVYRQGVTSNVRIHRILAQDTVDIVVRDRIESKAQDQASLLNAIKQYRKGLLT